jgi:D-Tyr-tRNAtyr deacylase
VASEAAYHLLGAKNSGWRPTRINVNEITHWWLENNNGDILDITATQFNFPVNYQAGRHTSFLTTKPSKRAQILIKMVINYEND